MNNNDGSAIEAALKLAGWTLDDVREYRVRGPGVWYVLTADGRASPL